MNASSTPPHSRPQPDFGHLGAASRHSYARPNLPLFSKAGESGFGGNWVLSATSSSPTSEFVPSRKAEIGEISDKDESDFAPVEVDIPTMDDEGAKNLLFSSSNFVHPCDIDSDMGFRWDSTPIISSLSVPKLPPGISKLQKKHRPCNRVSHWLRMRAIALAQIVCLNLYHQHHGISILMATPSLWTSQCCMCPQV